MILDNIGQNFWAFSQWLVLYIEGIMCDVLLHKSKDNCVFEKQNKKLLHADWRSM